MDILSSKLYKDENNTNIKHIYEKYLEIQLIKFIQRNRNQLQPRPPDDLGITCKHFRCSACLT